MKATNLISHYMPGQLGAAGSGRKATDIRVIVGNPPLLAGQNERRTTTNANVTYPILWMGGIRESYAPRSSKHQHALALRQLYHGRSDGIRQTRSAG